MNATKPTPKFKTVNVYRSPLAELPGIVIFFGLFISMFYFNREYPDTIQHIPLQLGDMLYFDISLPLFGILPILSFAYVAHRLLDDKYVIDQDSLREISGLLSFNKKDMRIQFENIRGIEIDRNLYERLVNVGDLKVGSAMHEGIEAHLAGIRNPSKYRDIILERMKAAKAQYSNVPHVVHD
ncbi:MAG: PH domain-containing protein [Deltaproteobacteria bacterium]|nr:PH domain-containing protein [Deltaproteobacteria bacterium]